MKTGKIRRYMVFSGFTCYPQGGWDDYRGAYYTVEEAVEAAERDPGRPDWWQIVDIEILEIVLLSLP